MTLPATSANTSLGDVMATHTIATKEYQTMMLADIDGHIQGSAPVYLLYQGARVLAAAAGDAWEIFNGVGSGKTIRFRGIWPALNQTAATAFVASFAFELRRISAVGTGGTAHTFEATTTPGAGAVNLARISTADPTLPAQITARSLATAGATNAAYLFSITLFSEDTQPSSHQLQLVNWLPEIPPGFQPFELLEGQGIKLRQTSAILSTGLSLGWLAAFTLVP
jgi:hypothetical protein